MVGGVGLGAALVGGGYYAYQQLPKPLRVGVRVEAPGITPIVDDELKPMRFAAAVRPLAESRRRAIRPALRGPAGPRGQHRRNRHRHAAGDAWPLAFRDRQSPCLRTVRGLARRAHFYRAARSRPIRRQCDVGEPTGDVRDACIRRHSGFRDVLPTPAAGPTNAGSSSACASRMRSRETSWRSALR